MYFGVEQQAGPQTREQSGAPIGPFDKLGEFEEEAGETSDWVISLNGERA